MGFWGTALYNNDCTCDVKDLYLQFIQTAADEEHTLQNLEELFRDYIGTDEEPLLWYALADTQWHFGRLLPEVREKALYWLQNNGGAEQWHGNAKREQGWAKTMDKLYAELQLPQRRKKKIENPAENQYNPGAPGDLFAYRFHTAQAAQMGCYGKYMLLQKIGEGVNSYDWVCPDFLAFDGLYDEIPDEIHVDELRVLPFDVPERFMPSGRHPDFPKLDMSAVLFLFKKRNSPEKYMHFIGSYPVRSLPDGCRTSGEFPWDNIEDILLAYHSYWKHYTYQLFENESVVTKVD